MEIIENNFSRTASPLSAWGAQTVILVPCHNGHSDSGDPGVLEEARETCWKRGYLVPMKCCYHELVITTFSEWGLLKKS